MNETLQWVLIGAVFVLQGVINFYTAKTITTINKTITSINGSIRLINETITALLANGGQRACLACGATDAELVDGDYGKGMGLYCRDAMACHDRQREKEDRS